MRIARSFLVTIGLAALFLAAPAIATKSTDELLQVGPATITGGAGCDIGREVPGVIRGENGYIFKLPLYHAFAGRSVNRYSDQQGCQLTVNVKPAAGYRYVVTDFALNGSTLLAAGASGEGRLTVIAAGLRATLRQPLVGPMAGEYGEPASWSTPLVTRLDRVSGSCARPGPVVVEEDVRVMVPKADSDDSWVSPVEEPGINVVQLWLVAEKCT